MALLDTNIFVYAADQRSDGHLTCRQLLEEFRLREEPWYTTWPILNEFLRVSTHPRVFKKPWSASAALGFIEAILKSPGLKILASSPEHFQTVRQIVREIPDLQGNIFHDVHTAALLREHGIAKIYTHDADFRRFPFLEVIDPLASS